MPFTCMRPLDAKTIATHKNTIYQLHNEAHTLTFHFMNLFFFLSVIIMYYIRETKRKKNI